MIKNFSSASELDLKKYHERDIISSWFQLAYNHRMAAALWRLPSDSSKCMVIDITGGNEAQKVDLEDTGSGFLVAPYHNPDRSQEIFLNAHLFYNCESGQLRTTPGIATETFEKLLSEFNEILSSRTTEPSFYLQDIAIESTPEVQYCSTVKDALENIHQGQFQKVVPAIIREVYLEDDFSCLKTFERLSDNYPAAFVSLVTAPGFGTWIGASPEAIIEVDRNNMFTTVAVAGTQEHKAGISLQDVAWKQKEIEEQALVSRYIINCFKKIRLREFVELGPKTVVAGNLLHLKSTYTVDIKETNFPLLGSVMLSLLHPTSAVCGMPKSPAQDFIGRHEQFNRELFSGYLGPVNVSEETHLFVNLRCMQIQPGGAILYAGAGVTEDSIPEKEWVETQLKCDTLLDVLKK